MDPPGNAREDWKIIRALSEVLLYVVMVISGTSSD